MHYFPRSIFDHYQPFFEALKDKIELAEPEFNSMFISPSEKYEHKAERYKQKSLAVFVGHADDMGVQLNAVVAIGMATDAYWKSLQEIHATIPNAPPMVEEKQMLAFTSIVRGFSMSEHMLHLPIILHQPENGFTATNPMRTSKGKFTDEDKVIYTNLGPVAVLSQFLNTNLMWLNA